MIAPPGLPLYDPDLAAAARAAARIVLRVLDVIRAYVLGAVASGLIMHAAVAATHRPAEPVEQFTTLCCPTVPAPQNGSKIKSPGFELALMSRSISFSGF